MELCVNVEPLNFVFLNLLVWVLADSDESKIRNQMESAIEGHCLNNVGL